MPHSYRRRNDPAMTTLFGSLVVRLKMTLCGIRKSTNQIQNFLLSPQQRAKVCHSTKSAYEPLHTRLARHHRNLRGGHSRSHYKWTSLKPAVSSRERCVKRTYQCRHHRMHAPPRGSVWHAVSPLLRSHAAARARTSFPSVPATAATKVIAQSLVKANSDAATKSNILAACAKVTRTGKTKSSKESR